MDKTTIGEKYYVQSIVITITLFFFYLLGVNNSFLYSSILDYKNIKSDVFDGTVYPIEFIPDPLELSYDQRKKNYSEIDSKYFIKTPIYNPSIFGKELDNLTPGTSEYSNTIIQRLTFTVPYMGTYNFDYKEFAGSHPGVDIIAPEGTPIKNIAAGVVVDVGFQGGGYGNYVLIKHNGVTLPDGTIGDIYSLYAHMSKVITVSGNKIKSGEIIGYVGQTGTATTPHLHFQIDLQAAPYSPYWPFTTNDMKIAKVGFFDGVNIGLGKENAILNTINPLKFVNENISPTQTLVLNNNIVEEKVENNTIQENNNDKQIIQDTITNTNSGVIDEVKKDEIVVIKDNQINQDIKLNEDTKIESNVQVLKKEDMLKTEVELLSTVNADIVLSESSDISLLSLNNNTLAYNSDDLSNSLEKIDDTNDDLEVKTNEDISNSNLENISQTGTGLENPPVYSDIPLINGELNGDSKLFFDIENDYKYFNELKYFKENNIIAGFTNGTFRPKNNITRIESLKIILLSNSIEPIKDQKSQFLDIDTNSWENTYLNSAVNSKIVSPYNKNFYPFRNVSRVEALKLILTLNGISFEMQENDLKLDDVNISDWYYKYVNYAIKNNLLVITNNKFYPNKPLTREELISILYKFIKK